MRIWLALRAFWNVLVDSAMAERVRGVLDGLAADAVTGPGGGTSSTSAQQSAAPEQHPAPAVARAGSREAGPRGGGRSEALTLLAALQREARFLDLVQEPLGGYSDEQVGAAARDVLRNTAAVLERLFALQPALKLEEGTPVDVPDGYDPLQYKVVGHVSGEPPFRGRLVHHGWIASRCELPGWTGSSQATHVIAPIEVEIG